MGILEHDILACLNAADPDDALITFAAKPLELEPVEGYERPAPIIGLTALLIADALLRVGRPDEVLPLFVRFSDAVAPPNRRGDGYWRMLVPFHFLHAPMIDASIARNRQADAIYLLNRCVKEMRTARPIVDPVCQTLLEHPVFANGSPVPITCDWLLDRHERIIALGDMNHALAEVQDFHAGFVECALIAEQPSRAVTLIERELPWYLSCPILGISHFEFDAICVLATLGRFDEAMVAARQLVRRGYHLPWRFNLDSATNMSWTQDMRQNEWLADLARTPAYQHFLANDLQGPMLGDEPEVNPLCVVRDGVWTGKKSKRCRVSRKLIQPGDAVVRYRKLFNRSSDGDLEMAAAEAFAASPWQLAREQFENDRIPLAQLFPLNDTRDAQLDRAPHIHAFAYDLARDPDRLDIEQAVALIADHSPPQIAYTWDTGSRANRWEPAFPPFAGADGHGDAIDLVWRLNKAGYREALLSELARLPDAKADKVFAMLATFDDARLRQAAAEHFQLPSLPKVMELVFKDRPKIEDHAALADFGSANTRYRAGLVAAMQAYGLHLYSNYRPKADWFLSGLEQFTRAGGSALIHFLIDHPQDDTVLDTVISKRWLPDKYAGSVVEYGSARPFYVRAAIFHVARHRPRELAAWLAPEFVARWNDMAYDRETVRMAKRLLNRA